MGGISIVVADSEYLIREGLKHLILSKSNFNIVGEATNEPALMRVLRRTQPDVVILDHNQPTHFDTETIPRVKKASPRTNILIISADEDKNNIFQVLENGINSFLTKRCDKEEIIDAVKATAKGEKFFCTTVLDYLLEKSFGKEESCAPTPLTPREIEVVQLIAKGLIAKEIASELKLSTHTVYTHRKNIMKKLKLGTASELVLYAVQQGIV